MIISFSNLLVPYLNLILIYSSGQVTVSIYRPCLIKFLNFVKLICVIYIPVVTVASYGIHPVRNRTQTRNILRPI